MTDWNGFSNSEIQTLKQENKTEPKPFRVLNPKVERSINKEVKKKNVLDEKKEKKVPIITQETENPLPLDVKPDVNPKVVFYDKRFEHAREGEDVNNVKGVEIVPKVCFESIDDFEKYNKEIKEENVEKKKVLLKAILDRAQKTREEQRRLAQLKKELEDVDKNVSVDISALRDSIEEHSLSFMKAQQRFERAEKEYITAKAEYNALSEKKQGLTEKLLLTIQQTEISKAKKLTELLQMLEILDEPTNPHAPNNHAEP